MFPCETTVEYVAVAAAIAPVPSDTRQSSSSASGCGGCGTYAKAIARQRILEGVGDAVDYVRIKYLAIMHRCMCVRK